MGYFFFLFYWGLETSWGFRLVQENSLWLEEDITILYGGARGKVMGGRVDVRINYYHISYRSSANFVSAGKKVFLFDN